MKTLKILLSEFLDQMEAAGRSGKTIRMQRHCVGHTLRWLEEAHGVVGPDQLNRQHIDLWSKAVRSRRKANGMPLAKNSIIKQFDSDRGFLQWLERNNALPVGLHKELPRIKPDQLLPTSVLRHDQMEVLLKHTDITTTDGFQLRAMEELLYTSGIRVGELLGLNLDSVDLGQGAEGAHRAVRAHGLRIS